MLYTHYIHMYIIYICTTYTYYIHMLHKPPLFSKHQRMAAFHLKSNFSTNSLPSRGNCTQLGSYQQSTSPTHTPGHHPSRAVGPHPPRPAPQSGADRVPRSRLFGPPRLWGTPRLAACAGHTPKVTRALLAMCFVVGGRRQRRLFEHCAVLTIRFFLDSGCA